MTDQAHVLIIGGGIAGLALSLFLKRAGFHCTIFEAYPRHAEVGGGLGLAANGMNVLDELGLAESVIEAGTICSVMAFRTTRGKLIGVAPYAPPGRYGRPAVTLSRAALHRIIAGEVERQGIALLYGKRLCAIEDGDAGIVARFEDGSEVQGDLVVGADGINSRVREIIIPDGPKPGFTGLVGVGGFVPRHAVPLERPDDERTMTLCFGPGGAFLGYAFGDRAPAAAGAFWWSALARTEPLSDDERAELSLDAIRDAVLEKGDGWFDTPVRLLAATTHTIAPLNLLDVAHLPRWWSGRVVLIGDAAHAMSPHSGQGASVALEDAICLAKKLRDEAPLSAACAAFERDRRRRAERIVAFGRRSGDTKKTRGPIATWLQRIAMPLFVRLAGFSQSWMQGYRVQWDH
jgi:2-polyprenyl-6-methoxyphenol hydroxylase-like FAD-dependent oxidoreductase